jgi:transcriptional regulator with PAS, ATPase and Fis domain
MDMNPLIGVSVAIRSVKEEIDLAARSNVRVLIIGERGVGKGIAAGLIHERSGRRTGPFVTINCAGVPDSLLESELFGRVRGSFTDTHQDMPGRLEAANRGTILLDEVGAMSLRMQTLLFRFLDTGESQREGSDEPLPLLDVRVIAATSRRLIDRIAEKTFRDDLYYRLNTICIEIPPLRDRPQDVPLLLDSFLQHYATFWQRGRPRLTRRAVSCLVAYDWPGNISELKTVAERLVFGHQIDEIDAEILRAEITASGQQAVPAS